MTSIPSAVDQLTAVAQEVVKTDRGAFAELMRAGVTPHAESVHLTNKLDTALTALMVAKGAAAGAPVHQIIAAASGHLEEIVHRQLTTDDAVALAQQALQALSVLSMVLGLTEVDGPAVERTIRDLRQEVVLGWAVDRFGEISEPTNPAERGERFLEEAVELHQAIAEGNPTAMALQAARARAHQIVDHVYDKPPGEVRQELGGCAITLQAVAQVFGASLQAQEVTEFERILAIPKEAFADRHARKQASGLAAKKSDG